MNVDSHGLAVGQDNRGHSSHVTLGGAAEPGDRSSRQMQGQSQRGSSDIFVQQDRKELSRVAREENEKLNTIGDVGSTLRLAREAKVFGTGNLMIEPLGFGSGFFRLGVK
ncbi:hypothetical protein [Bradyrhizobium cenepequi]|uniref:hypothetical protein n=1 Tax=Bradyrhizobium cenepequi TaxID=2821403 RepID=UPI001CE31E2C|nr:hypothetical protein [Bradyrhizobium cenepequi]